MKMVSIVTGLAAFIILASNQTFAQSNPSSGNSMYEGCRDASSRNSSQRSPIDAGFCFGTVRTTIYFLGSDKFCPPEGGNTLQGVRVLVQYMENRPQDLHLPLAELAERAFTQAWPCKG
jgi:hypothetical protein